MKNKKLTHFNILEVKKAYALGKNITEILRAQKNISINTSEVIETAYDLQAGTYIEYVKNFHDQNLLYTTEIAQVLNNHINSNDKLLDIGTGELTTLSYLITALTKKPKYIYAFDISWSRIYQGIAFAKTIIGNEYQKIKPFVADIGEIPLLDKSINVTTSSHALEPNGGQLKVLLMELFRVTIDKLILFEPCYEINNKEGKDRMDSLGYIKNLAQIANDLGGNIIDIIPIKNISNPLNPTVCFIIKPPTIAPELKKNLNDTFSVPGTNKPLKKIDNFYFSTETGLCYPILKKIPILKSKCSILATSLNN